MAATSASWLTPPNGTNFCVGTTTTLTGQAAGMGQTGGTGLDLVLVMDSSGSMGYNGGQAAQKSAAQALVAALPQATTSVGIVEFDSSARTVLGLTQLNGTNTGVNTAINSVDASGGTTIYTGVNQASSVLATTYNATRLQAMVVMSDGDDNAASWDDSYADSAVSSGNVEAIHSVAMGNSASPASLKAVVNGPDDIYGNTDDYGTYNYSSIAALIGIFSGTTGNLVGLDHIDITTPDGIIHNNYSYDGLGNFNLDWILTLGANNFLVKAWGTDGTTATANWTLYGTNCNNVPEPATMLLFGTGLAGLVGYRRKKAQN
jgi:hypothetical protein